MSNELSRDERLSFLRLDTDQKTRDAFKDLAPVLARNIERILDGFYAHLGRQSALAPLVRGPGKVDQLKAAQRQHWGQLFDGSFSPAFLDQARRIGEAHERIGLAPHWYIAGYAFVIAELIPALVAEYRRKPERLSAALTAAMKAIFLDMEVAISVYNEKRA